jgi:uncharacterized repeat protein (TIGR04076 family)
MGEYVYDTPSIKITVLEAAEQPCRYRPGDSWVVSTFEAPGGLCTWAITAMAPYLATLRFGGSLPWEEDKDRAVVCCPDAPRPVIFELRRMPRD